jgi:hypothetical protein
MKYEAKNVSGIATSQVALTPWVSISQTSAATNSVAACTSCHLITEAEWMTIAQNILSVPGNWSNGTVGNGYIPRGNSDSSAATDAATDLTGVHKRTLTLTNGEIIWDLAGNVYEWTSGVTNGVTAQQPGITGAGWVVREWTQITANGSLSINPSPAGTGLSGASAWSSNQDIGQVYSSSDEPNLHSFLRSGNWSANIFVGVLALNLGFGTSSTDPAIGFRVSR